jgi:hypothetical protein
VRVFENACFYAVFEESGMIYGWLINDNLKLMGLAGIAPGETKPETGLLAPTCARRGKTPQTARIGFDLERDILFAGEEA